MSKKTVRGGKTDFHPKGREKTFTDLPKIPPIPFAFLMVHLLYVIK